MNAKVQKQMQNCLVGLGTSLIVRWKPDVSKSVHGELKDKILFIYDEEESEAWNTFTHEVFEFKLQAVTRPYRLLVNSLIEVIEKSVYSQKEEFIEFLPKIIGIIKETKGENYVGKVEKT
jgi:hypothetical protein